MIILLILSIISLFTMMILLVQNFCLIYLGLINLSLSFGFHSQIWIVNIISIIICIIGLRIFIKSMELNDAKEVIPAQ